MYHPTSFLLLSKKTYHKKIKNKNCFPLVHVQHISLKPEDKPCKTTFFTINEPKSQVEHFILHCPMRDMRRKTKTIPRTLALN